MEKAKKKWFLGILSCLIIIGIGGKFYIDMKEKQNEQELLAVERQSVKVLKNTFADIAEVKIEQTGYNSMTGSYNMVVTMKNIHGKSIGFSYGFRINDKKIRTYSVENETIQKEGITKSGVRIIHSNGKQEEI